MGLQATNAGIDFQQRVSAYMMILMEFDMDISLALQVNKSNTIKEINFEDCESIDDLVITLDSGKKLYFQMKRTISLSDDAESEFYGVCEQFVKQFLKQNENDLAYILAIRTESSKAISVKLKRILEGIRLANNLEVIDKLNREERTIFGKVSANIKTIYKKYTSKDISEVAHRDRNGGSSAPDRWLILAQIIYGMFLCIPGWHRGCIVDTKLSCFWTICVIKNRTI